jgi:hypothetical protein
MNKNVKHLAIVSVILLPVITVLVWVIWALLLPSFRDHFLHTVSTKVEKNILKNQKRRSKGLRVGSMKKSVK